MTHWKEYYSPELLLEKLSHSQVFMIYVDNEPAATISLSTDRISYYESADMEHFQDPTAEALYVSALGVRPQFQGKGLAKELMRIAEETARVSGLRYIRFDARGKYTELITFYQKLGYAHVGNIDDEGEPYFLMEKVID